MKTMELLSAFCVRVYVEEQFCMVTIC